jgi:tetratricopeptide (TPR) repeat protein
MAMMLLWAGVLQARRFTVLVAALVLAAGAWAEGDPAVDCFSEDIERRIKGCTALIERGDWSVADLCYVYAMRGLAFSVTGRYAAAISDYDVAIRMKPDFSVALNNRAWAYFRWGKGPTGLDDVERSLQLNPTSPNALDTRAHIYQALGRVREALHDYDQAMLNGGSRMIKLYQCGLTEARLYSGGIDGAQRPELAQALERCAQDKECDPLPIAELAPPQVGGRSSSTQKDERGVRDQRTCTNGP